MNYMCSVTFYSYKASFPFDESNLVERLFPMHSEQSLLTFWTLKHETVVMVDP
jgi:hypothetical protein